MGRRACFRRLVRVTPDGALDHTFGDGGSVTLGGSSSSWRPGLTALPGGPSAILQWRTDDGARYDMHVWRVLGDGSPDADFGAGGLATDVYVDNGNYRFDAALSPAGEIVVASGFIGRLRADGSLDTGFGDLGATPLSGTVLAVAHPGGRIFVGFRPSFSDYFTLLCLRP